MADLLKFKHGLQANMKENSPAITAGTVYITRDERAMYVDLPPYQNTDGTTEAAKRIRIGDMRVYEYLDELKADLTSDMTALTTSALYYAEKDNATNNNVINALLKWNGEKFVQLNSTSDIVANVSSLTDRVGVVEDSIADHKTRIEGLETAVNTTIPSTYATKTELNTAKSDLNTAIGKKADQTALEALDEEVGDLTQTVGDNKAAVDTAIEGLTNILNSEIDRAKKAEKANADNISTNTENITKNTNAITVLNGDISTTGSVKKQIKDAVDAESSARAQAVTTIEGKITTINGEIDSIKQTNTDQDTEIAKKLNKAQGSGNANKVMVTDTSGNIVPGTISTEKLGYLSDVTSNIQNQISGLNTSIGTTNNNLSAAVTRIDAAEGNIEQNKTDIKTNADNISDIQDELEALKGTSEGSIADQISDAVAAEAALRSQADTKHTTDISTLNNKVAALETADEGFATNYVKKTDAPGYEDILTKTSANSTYATKTELNTAKTTLIGVSGDATTKDTIWAAKNMATAASNAASAAQTQADSGVSKANAAQQTIDNYKVANDAALKAEADRAKAAEKVNADAITDEVNRAKAAEKVNADAIAAEKTRAEGVEEDHNERIERMELFFASADPDTSEQLVDTLKELQEYIASDTSGAATMAGNIQTNTQDISGLKTRMTTAEGNITTLTNGLAAEITNREQAVNDAIDTSKDYTDSALTWGTF